MVALVKGASRVTYKLFLDDERDPPEEHRDAIIVRSFDEATYYVVLHGVGSHISFDHDLGAGPTGYDFVKWMCEIDTDLEGGFIPDDFTFEVHSANPIGRTDIESYLTRYLEQRPK
jgi:hypothetical protein